MKLAGLAVLFVLALPAHAFADRLLLVDGTTIEVDEAWDDAEGVWYRRGGITNFVERARVKTIERKGDAKETSKGRQLARLSEVDAASDESKQTSQANEPVRPLWIYLVGGARFEVDEAQESAEGVWYKRGNLSIFLERARIERIERESDEAAAEDVDKDAVVARAVKRERRWTTGRPQLDALIRQNGARYGVDPYLIFCVMEQESHFNAGAVSPVGARGLMQLMPATAARFGVRSIHDPAQNIAGGTRFLKQLLARFNGRVELVLASYNAGEGAVLKYGHRVPPYRETRNYVRRISDRYGRAAHAFGAETRAVGQTTKRTNAGAKTAAASNKTTAVVDKATTVDGKTTAAEGKTTAASSKTSTLTVVN
ncbi:MAG TPA: lytic transglycosylase domain-containing protein [Pyrinomonadaceae bacterium]|nr:lytic transglycosylase domain-containing protein [Pyrinomonadaceae bacterium]